MEEENGRRERLPRGQQTQIHKRNGELETQRTGVPRETAGRAWRMRATQEKSGEKEVKI
jgi:hypothetical protein